MQSLPVPRTADRRSTTNRNVRGSSYARRARKVWLLLHFDLDLGPDKARCSFCLAEVTIETISADRFPDLGGSYRHGNIRPSCLPCNVSEGGKVGYQRLKAKREKDEMDATVQALTREIEHLQAQMALAPVIHAAVISGGVFIGEGLWGPRCNPDLLWTVPLVGHDQERIGEDSPLVTCKNCIAAKEAQDARAAQRDAMLRRG